MPSSRYVQSPQIGLERVSRPLRAWTRTHQALPGLSVGASFDTPLLLEGNGGFVRLPAASGVHEVEAVFTSQRESEGAVQMQGSGSASSYGTTWTW